MQSMINYARHLLQWLGESISFDKKKKRKKCWGRVYVRCIFYCAGIDIAKLIHRERANEKNTVSQKGELWSDGQNGIRFLVVRSHYDAVNYQWDTDRWMRQKSTSTGRASTVCETNKVSKKQILCFLVWTTHESRTITKNFSLVSSRSFFLSTFRSLFMHIHLKSTGCCVGSFGVGIFPCIFSYPKKRHCILLQPWFEQWIFIRFDSLFRLVSTFELFFFADCLHFVRLHVFCLSTQKCAPNVMNIFHVFLFVIKMGIVRERRNENGRKKSVSFLLDDLAYLAAFDSVANGSA